VCCSVCCSLNLLPDLSQPYLCVAVRVLVCVAGGVVVCVEVRVAVCVAVCVAVRGMKVQMTLCWQVECVLQCVL